jgi:hypothetical protein
VIGEPAVERDSSTSASGPVAEWRVVFGGCPPSSLADLHR